MFSFDAELTLCDSSAQSIATSDHHPFVASTSADGTCILGNAVRAMKRKPHKVRALRRGAMFLHRF